MAGGAGVAPKHPKLGVYRADADTQDFKDSRRRDGGAELGRIRRFAGTPSGKVRITAGQTTLCTVQLSDRTGTCSSASPTVLSAGKAALVASYPGDLGLRGSSADATLTVRRATSRTTLTLSSAPVKYENETSLKIAIAVAPQFSGTPPGTSSSLQARPGHVVHRAAGQRHTHLLAAITVGTQPRPARAYRVLPGEHRLRTVIGCEDAHGDQALTPGSDALRHRSSSRSLPMISLHGSSGCPLTSATSG